MLNHWNLSRFTGHGATRGCSKFNKEFPDGIGEKDYSGFDVKNWPKRTGEVHRQQMMEICQKTTKGEKEKLESEYGTRLSNLILLPYYDSVRFAIIDPMHNLFLGTAKKMINVWKKRNFWLKRH